MSEKEREICKFEMASPNDDNVFPRFSLRSM